MTVMLTPSVTSSFPENLDEDAYIVTMAVNSGLVVGSVAIFDEQTSIAVWGDDSSWEWRCYIKRINHLLSC